MRANKLKLHLGEAINATIITLGSLMLIVGISKFIYRLPEISISDMAMSAIGIAALIVHIFRIIILKPHRGNDTDMIRRLGLPKNDQSKAFTVGKYKSIKSISEHRK